MVKDMRKIKEMIVDNYSFNRILDFLINCIMVL